MKSNAEAVAIPAERGRTSDYVALAKPRLNFLVVASGTSDRHVQGIAELCRQTLDSEGAAALGSEGLREGQWALVDFGDVVLHVFHQFTREVYALEEMWPANRIRRIAEPKATVAQPGWAQAL